jgi:hypothetical protein
VALWPAYTFISASYNNDNLAAPLVAASLLALVSGLRRKGELRLWAAAALLGVLAAFSKRTAWALLPVLVLALIPYGVLQLRSGWPRGKVVGGVLLALGLCGAAAFIVPLAFPFHLSADLARMLRLSPDALLNLSGKLGALRTVDWGWWFTFMLDSFSAQFGWVFDWLPGTLAIALRLLYLSVTAGCLVALVRALLARRQGPVGVKILGAALLAAGVAVGLLFMAAQYIAEPASYPPQGRYLFPFISAIGILAVIGWEAFWPERLRSVGLAVGLVLVAAFDLYCWAVLLIPYYYL